MSAACRLQRLCGRCRGSDGDALLFRVQPPAETKLITLGRRNGRAWSAVDTVHLRYYFFEIGFEELL